MGKTVTTDKLQVHTVTHKVDLKINRHGKHFLPQQHSNLLPHTCRLNWDTFVSAAKFTR